MRQNRFGLAIALATPFADDRSIDSPRLAHVRDQALADRCASLGQADVRRLTNAIDTIRTRQAA